MSDIAHIEAGLKAWDEVDGAAQGIATALPDKMTAAAARLERARLEMRPILQRAALALMTKPSQT